MKRIGLNESAHPAGPARQELQELREIVPASSCPRDFIWKESKCRKWEAPVLCALLASLVWGVFGQTLRFKFINLDDMFVYQTPQITRGLTLDGIMWAFTHSHGDLWLPLTTVTHMLDCQFYGLWAGGHHLTNVLLHAATAILLFLILREMTGALWRSAFVAACFAIHPLRVESVAWVTERKDVLSGVFFMLTLWAYTRYTRRPEAGISYLMVLVWFALGLLSKSMLVTVPFVLLLLDYWPLGRLRNASQLPALLKEKLPIFALSIFSCVAAVLAAKNDIQPVQHIAFFLRLCNALVAYVVYLEKLVHPSQLAVFYPLVKGGGTAWQVVVACLLLIGLTAAACAAPRKCPYLLVGWLWYLGMLVPVIGIVQVGVQAYADRFTYLPQVGLCIAGAWAAADWAGVHRHRRGALACAAAAALSCLAVAAARQTDYWRDSITLWTHTQACTRDNIVTRYSFGNALAEQGRNEEAAAQFRGALRIDPTFLQAYSNLGVVLFRQGRIDEGIAEFQKAFKINPNFPQGHSTLGNALMEMGRTTEAIAEFHAALQTDPDYPAAHYSLGKALLAQGQMEEGIRELREASRLDPDDERNHDSLGIALFRQGRVEEGISEFRQALRLNPNDAHVHNNLAKGLLGQGCTGQAIAEAQKALELQPGDGAFENNLAWMLATAQPASLRDGAMAVQLAMEASKSSGGHDPGILCTLAAGYAEEGKYRDAIRIAQSALQLAPTREVAETLRRDIKVYESGHSLPDGQ